MVGMRDVAKKAGVSLSTVSLVVNASGYVSQEMRRRVEQAMRELDYIPNELARNLYRGRTGMIGVIVPTLRHPFFATLVSALQGRLAKCELQTLLCSTADADTGEAEYVSRLRRHMMDGIIMAAHTDHPADYWTSIGRPVVAFDRALGDTIATVRSDHEQGGRLVAEQLVKSGARHVVMVGGPRSQFDDRGEGATTFPTVRYFQTLGERLDAAGIRHEYVACGPVTDVEGYARAVHLLFDRLSESRSGGSAGGSAHDSGVGDAGIPPVDAIVGSDVVAACAVKEAFAHGLNVPRDVQIIGYDGTCLVDCAGLTLTVVKQNFDAIAERLAARIVDAVNEPEGRESKDGEDSKAGKESKNAAAVDIVPVSLHVGDTTRQMA
ncbi:MULTISPECIES: LacI family DNA-binding transcriptional regulator [Bifidobacterium]|uniref:LacI family DNA-binding transcriptional regulator n=1 Tax=Bifidobacterium TaxID=1678 RepID=UPI0026EEF439|nr:LacI family DNA-binding transcriptional regulator [Bifidobacterium thermacidophilum]